MNDTTIELDELRKQIADLSQERDASRAELERLRTLFEATLETVPVGVLVADPEGRILHGNSNIPRTLGHQVHHSADAQSYDDWVSFHEDGTRILSREYPLSKVILEGAEHAELDLHYQHGSGSRFWVRAIAEPIHDRDGKMLGAAVALIDIDAERQLREMQATLIAELNHQVKNAFSVTRAIVNRTLRGDHAGEHMIASVDDRLTAYAEAHSRMLDDKRRCIPLAELARNVLENVAGDRVTIGGPPVELKSSIGLTMSIVFDELAKNARKYGALSTPQGMIELSWSLLPEPNGPEGARRLRITWRETGGPEVTELPAGKGFGTFMTGRAIAAQTGGTFRRELEEGGFVWELDMPYAEERRMYG